MQIKKIKKISVLILSTICLGVGLYQYQLILKKDSSKNSLYNYGDDNKYGLYLSNIYANIKGDYNKLFSSYESAVLQNQQDFLGRSFVLTTLLNSSAEEKLVLAEVEYAKDNNDIVPVLYLSNYHFSQGNYNKALEFLKVHKSNSNNFIVKLFEAWNLVGLNRYTEAINILEPYASKQTFGKFALMHLAIISELKGDNSKADKYYQQVLVANNLNLFDIENIISFYIRKGDMDKVSKIVDDYSQKRPDSVSIISLIHAINNNMYEVDIIDTPQKGMAKAVFDTASILNIVLPSAFDLYLMYINMATELYPEFYMAKFMKSEFYKQINWIAAFQEEASQIPETHYLNLTNKINVASFEGKENSANKLTMYLSLLKQYPNIPHIYIQLGNYYSEQGAFEKSINYYSEALEKATNDKIMADIYLMRAGLYDKQGEFQKAEEDLENAFKLNSNNSDLLNYYGYFLIQKNPDANEVDLERGITMIESALNKQHYNPYYIDSYAWALFKTGDIEGALSMLEIAKALKPTSPVICDHLGDIYWELGREREAVYEWKKALQYEKDNPNKEEPLDVKFIKSKIKQFIN